MAGLRSVSPRVPATASLWLLLTACSFDAVGLGPSDTGVAELTTGTSSGPGTGEPTGTGAESSASSGTGGPVQPMTTSAGEDTTAADSSTTAADPSTTTADPGTSTGCVELEFFADSDGDGFGSVGASMLACEAPAGYVSNSEDCDDEDEDSYPGGAEVCDAADNDCDAVIDEFAPTNTDCGGCKMALYVPNNTVYHFCTDVEKWGAARGACEQRDGVLAKDEDLEHHEWLLDQLPGASGPWWIGGTSPDKDDDFVWLADGSAVPGGDDERWAVGRPWGGGDDRMVLVSNGNTVPWMSSSGRWYDREDKDQQPYICQSPYTP